MPGFSTVDCKMFLAKNRPLQPNGWKRVSKAKDALGRVVRWFEHSTGERVALAVTPSGLVDITHEFSSPATGAVGPWDYTRKAFDPAALSVAKLLFEAADQTKQMLGVGPSSLGYDAIPGLFAFSFFDPAGERESTIDDVLANPEPDAIVAGVGVFFVLRHHDYGCNHLSWALKAFLPDYFEEVEESFFAMDEEWHMARSSDHRAAIADGSIRQVKLMDIVRDLSARGFHYDPELCVFQDILFPGARSTRLNFANEASTAGHCVVQFVHTNQRSKGFSSWVIALLLFCPMTKPAPGRMIPSWAQKLRRP